MSKERILLVEDELISAFAIKYYLEKIGYNVICSVDKAETAIIKAEELQPDLILMDIFLRGKMSGITAADYINRKLSVPVVFMSASTDDATTKCLLEINHYGFIRKPFEDEDLQLAVKSALRNYRLNQPQNIVQAMHLTDCKK